MRRLAIIPARGGSKRIPRKNIKDFRGKPIIAYPLEAALGSNLFEEVMVSTDDKEIAKVAENLGASVPFLRSPENSDDNATTAEVIEEVLNAYLLKGDTFDEVCCIYPTAALLESTTLIEAQNIFRENSFDCVFAALSYEHPIERAFHVEDDHRITFRFEGSVLSRTQDIRASYHDAGQFYWLNPASFLVSKQIFSRDTGAMVLQPLQAQDIDTIEDWRLAELKAEILDSNKN